MQNLNRDHTAPRPEGGFAAPLPTRLPLTAILATLAMIIGLMVTAAPPADAATYPSRVNRDVGMYDCPGSQARCTTRIATARIDTKATMICWEDGRSAAGSVRWFYVKLDNGREGFVPANRVSSQTSVKACWDKNASTRIDGVIAANWALKHLNKEEPTSAENRRLHQMYGSLPLNWMEGDWSGDCISFVALAWYPAGLTMRHGNAVDVYRYYKNKGTLKTSANPPRGALVFWPNASRWGHVALSLGNGRVISTNGTDGAGTPIKIYGVNHWGKPSGWAWPTG